MTAKTTLHSIRTASAAALVGLLVAFPSAQADKKEHDYPTFALAEYVFVCMSVNGESEYILRQCSCAIDKIAERMSYDDYVAAEAAIRLRQMQGEKASQFREVEVVRKTILQLEEAQAEAEIACF